MSTLAAIGGRSAGLRALACRKAFLDHGARNLIQPGHPVGLSLTEALNKLRGVSRAIRAVAIAICCVKKVEGLDYGQCVALVSNRGINAFEQDLALPRMRRNKHDAVRHRHGSFGKSGWPSARRLFKAVRRLLLRLFIVKRIKARATGIADQDNALEACLFQEVQAGRHIQKC